MSTPHRMLRLNRQLHTLVPTTNLYSAETEIQQLLIKSEKPRPHIYVSRISANLLRGYDTYQLPKTLHYHCTNTRRGSKIVGAAYGQQTTHTKKYHVYSLDSRAFETFQGIPTLTVPALIIDYLLDADPFAAIANAEAVIRGHLRPDVRLRSACEAQFQILLKQVQELLDASSMRAKRRVQTRLKYLSQWSESIGESVAKVALLLAGIALPEQQVNIQAERGTYRVDFLWRKALIVCEFDGAVKYAGQNGSQTLFAEKVREDFLRRHFNNVIRLTWTDAHNRQFMLGLRNLFPKELLRRPMKQI